MCRVCVGTLFTNKSLYSGWSSSAAEPGSQDGPSRRAFMALAGAAAGVAGLALPSGRALAETTGAADVIFQGGTIIPMSAAGPKRAEALAVRGGKIVAVGSQSDMAALQTATTKIVDLGGRTLLPGFIDPHQHTCFVALFSELLADVGYATYPTRADLIAGLKALDAKLPAGEWLMGYNFDNLLQGGDLSMAELDGVSKDRPIMIWYINMHDGAANAAAFKVAQIPQDIGALPGGGHFGRDADGKLNGLIYEESAMLKVVPFGLPKITPAIFAKAMTDYFKLSASLGNTTTHEPGTVQPEWIEGLVKLTASGTGRLSASIMYDDMKAGDAYRDLGRGATATLFPNSRFSLYGIKIVGDGSNQTKTGAQTIPYLGTDWKGNPNYTPAELKTMVAAIKEAGWPVQIHCNGDAVIDSALDAIEAAYGANPPTGINRIEHSTLARPDQLARMKKLGVEPSFLMNHVYLYGAAYRDQLFGPERAAFMDPAGACVKEELPFTLHTDAPCSPLGPLRLIQTAVTRRCIVDNSIVGPDQAVTVEEAIRAVTASAAAQIGQADRIGTLETGKEADLVILEQDPFKVAPDEIMKIKVSETWVAGEKIFG
ncbi:amidohydrolase [Kaistia dalseonensis]|uniref:Amidohydrolase YtcJ n=1 Tax=Kaistia dalseonensis TaxID=410840 RepID=A0ABU0H6B3_9HYPH|nr:amidohydrolase [Kaistia dalseonensis]MCX5494427.1 amidohydrolase [Kaistia dalseonensis]MDQ0437006.1 putative amidohydrolase YtcJ [Kaistia dalseonensis]